MFYFKNQYKINGKRLDFSFQILYICNVNNDRKYYYLNLNFFNYERISGALSAQKYVNQEDSQVLYYVRQKSGTVRVMDVNKLADAIEANSSLTAGDVKHAIEAFVEQLRLSLTQGDKVKIDGLGTFHITLSSEGTEKEKDCTVRSIRRVNVRFVADKALHLVNTSHTATRSENNVDFVLAGKGEGETDGSDDGNGGNDKPGGGGVTPDPSV